MAQSFRNGSTGNVAIGWEPRQKKVISRPYVEATKVHVAKECAKMWGIGVMASYITIPYKRLRATVRRIARGRDMYQRTSRSMYLHISYFIFPTRCQGCMDSGGLTPQHSLLHITYQSGMKWP